MYSSIFFGYIFQTIHDFLKLIIVNSYYAKIFLQ